MESISILRMVYIFDIVCYKKLEEEMNYGAAVLISQVKTLPDKRKLTK